LGTSSILAATVLEAVGRAFALEWSREDVCQLTLVLEQLLTAGGGWQDQYGGIYGGAKLLTTLPGSVQRPMIEQLPTDLWTHPDLAPRHLLYFTGMTRMARQILAEIVRDMYLQNPAQRHLLMQMKAEAQLMATALRVSASTNDLQAAFTAYGRLLRLNWQRNQQLDAGCLPPAIARLTTLIDDLCEGYKLPGAGGGGFLYLVAKDAEAACRIRQILNENALSPTARFYEMSVHP
jgi:galactokinase/mevalonate kinase-like predicted kinase